MNMPNIDYIKILKDAWRITWKNRFLWWFGIFLTLGGGFSGNMNYTADEKNQHLSRQASAFISQHLALIVIGAVICAVIFLVLMIIGIIARAGVIRSLNHLSKDEETGFRSGMREGKKYFWKLLTIYLLLGIFIIISLIVLVTPIIFLFSTGSWILGILLAIIAILIIIPLFILVSYLKTYGEIYIVAGDMPSCWPAIERSYELLRKNLLASIIMGLFFIPIGIVLTMGMLIIIAPLAALAFLSFMFLGGFGIVIGSLFAIVIFLIILAIQSVFQIFHQAAWLLFFREIATPKEEEKILEVLEEEVNVPETLPSTGEVAKTVSTEE